MTLRAARASSLEHGEKFAERLRPIPVPVQHELPIDLWQHVTLHQKHRVTFAVLSEGERFFRLQFIVELGHYAGIVAGDERTGCVAIVSGRQWFAGQEAADVLVQDSGLAGCG